MGDIVWKEVFSDSAYNSITAAAAKEAIQSTLHHRDKFGPFNRLMVHNMDAVNIKIYLDGLDVGGRIFEVSAGENLLIEPEDGITFTMLQQENIDAAVAEVANKILFRWAKMERV